MTDYEIAVRRKNEVFGEISFLDGQPVSSSVVAKTPLTLAVLDCITCDATPSTQRLRVSIIGALRGQLAADLRESIETRLETVEHEAEFSRYKTAVGRIVVTTLSLAFFIIAILLTASNIGVRAQDWAPKWTADGQLELPRNYRNWIFLGSPLTPNALNDGKAAFPEYHNVYVPAEVLANFKKTGEYKDGDIFVKELQLTVSQEFPDGSRTERSGRGYFPAAFNGMDVMVKDSKRCKETEGWCYINFGHHAPPYEQKSAVAPKNKCAFCHLESADKNQHFTEFYQQRQH